VVKTRKEEEEKVKRMKQRIRDKEKEISLLKDEINARTSVNTRDGKRTLIIGPNEQNLRNEIAKKQNEISLLEERISDKKEMVKRMHVRFNDAQEEFKKRKERPKG
jgi:peptidoglycan hydrolase CwlO-like protein